MGKFGFRPVFLILVLALVFTYAANQIEDYDTFYHLAAGRYMAETGTIPEIDVFSYTAPEGPWITHEWLAQVVFFWIFAAGGPWALIFFVAAVAALTYGFVYLLARRMGAGSAAALALILPFAALTWELWIPRPQIFSYFLLVLLFFLLEGYARKKDARLLLLAAASVWLWANLHAAVILGIVVFLFFAAAETAKHFLPALAGAPRLEARELRILWLAAAGSAVLSFINPNTYKSVLYPLFIDEAITELDVLEWRPLTEFLYLGEAQAFLALLLAVNVFLWARYLSTPRGRDLAAIGFVAGISVLPFISIRHVAFFPLAAVPAMSAALTATAADLPERFRIRRELRQMLAGAAGALLLVMLFRSAASLPQEPLNRRNLSIDAVDFIHASGLAGPGFNFANDGGYFEWKLFPEQKVFMDGRSETFVGEPLRDFLAVARMEPGWERLVHEKYGINYFLLWYREPLARLAGPLTRELVESHGFRLVYWDDAAIILAREAPRNAEIIRSHGVSRVNPFLDPRSIPDAEREAAERELDLLLARSPDSHELRHYWSLFLSGQR